MKRPQTKFQIDAMRGFKVIKSRKSQNSALGQKKIYHIFFSTLIILVPQLTNKLGKLC